MCLGYALDTTAAVTISYLDTLLFYNKYDYSIASNLKSSLQVKDINSILY